MIAMTWIWAIISAYPVFIRADSGSLSELDMVQKNDNCGVVWVHEWIIIDIVKDYVKFYSDTLYISYEREK